MSELSTEYCAVVEHYTNSVESVELITTRDSAESELSTEQWSSTRDRADSELNIEHWSPGKSSVRADH